MAKKGKFSQPRTYKPRDLGSDLSFLDAIEDPVPTPPPADPVPEASEPVEPFGELPVEDAPAAPVTVANDPLLADAALSLDDLGEDDDGVDFEEDEPEAPKGKNKKLILISLCSVAVVALIGLVSAVAFLLGGGKDDGLILNNVTVAGVNLGGMSQEEAVRVLRGATNHTYSQQDMIIVLPEATLTLSPANTGAKLDVEAAAEAAYLYGRTGNRAEREAARNQVLTGAHHIALLPYLQLNTDYIRQELERYCDAYSTDFVPSSSSLEGQMPELDGEKFDPEAPCQTLLLNTGVPGRNLDPEKLYNAVLDAYSFNSFLVDIEASGLAEEPEKLDLEALLEELYREPVSAYMNAETREIVPEVYGYGFDIEKAQELLDAAEPGDTVSIPMEYVTPEYTRESLFGDVLGACETPHTIDENRNTNLRLVCETINGMILMPGDLFDFNVEVGERTLEKGYKYAAAYSSGQTVKDVGGGICQISSTLYLAALRADLEIVERTEHSYISSYIPYGMDATVSWRGPEFRFRNNYTHPIRIDAWVADGYVHVNLMSIDERDYYVDMEYQILAWESYETVYEEYAPDNAEGYKDGDVITTPYTGCVVRTYRCRYDKATGELISREEEVRSRYKKRDEVIAKVSDATEEPTEGTTEGGGTEDPTENPGTDATDPPPATDPPATDPPVTPPPEDSENP